MELLHKDKKGPMNRTFLICWIEECGLEIFCGDCDSRIRHCESWMDVTTFW